MERLKYQNNIHPILSIFSGGGFLDLGFMNQGFQIIEAVEIHKPFVDMYNAGIKSCVQKSQKAIFKDKIVTAPEILKPLDASLDATHSELVKNAAGAVGIIGGPPCQDFSAGGKNKGTDGERGKMIYTYLSIVQKINPQFIFFENVAGLYHHKSHQLGFFNLKNQLEQNYHLWYDILNALEYGVPQDRSRLTLVGFRKDIVEKLVENDYKLIIDENGRAEDLVFKWPQKKFNAPKQLKWPQTSAFGQHFNIDDLLIPKKYSDLFVVNAFNGLNSKSANHDECFEPHSLKFKTIAEGDTYRKSFKRLHRYRYSPTVAYGNNEVHLHPTEARRLTVREALRLQSVPDSYVLPKEIGLTHKFKLISNGVPTKKADLIAQEIKRTLNNYNALK